MFKNLTLAASLLTTLAFSACAVQEGPSTGDLALEDTDLSGVGKADHISLNFTEMRVTIDRDLTAEGGVSIVTSSESFEEYFGVPAPTDIDFDKEWVAFYGIGTRDSGGFGAQITGISMLPTSYGGMIIETTDTSPGASCLVTKAITWPHTIVKFDRPTTIPEWFSMDSSSVVTSCGSDNDDREVELVGKCTYAEGTQIEEGAPYLYLHKDSSDSLFVSLDNASNAERIDEQTLANPVSYISAAIEDGQVSWQMGDETIFILLGNAELEDLSGQTINSLGPLPSGLQGRAYPVCYFF